jgi:prepilin-type N-terminal cleavage/methylation domain-containing protein
VTPDRAKRHRAQAGTTLIELLVATVIIGVALVLLVGLFSTGAIDSRLAAHYTAAEAAVSYEIEKIGAMQYSTSPSGYSECFASDGTGPTVVSYQGSCSGAAGLRADVSPSQPQDSPQTWTIQINSWPAPAPIGTAVSIYKVNR